MQLHTLNRKTKRKTSRQIGRGSKRGKTSGRGGKGQTARAGAKLRPEIREVIKKIPKLRGRGVNINKSFAIKPIVLNVVDFNDIDIKGTITPLALVEAGVIELKKGKVPSVKVLGDGELTKAITLKNITVSASALQKIEAAGGKVIPKNN